MDTGVFGDGGDFNIFATGFYSDDTCFRTPSITRAKGKMGALFRRVRVWRKIQWLQDMDEAVIASDSGGQKRPCQRTIATAGRIAAT